MIESRLLLYDESRLMAQKAAWLLGILKYYSWLKKACTCCCPQLGSVAELFSLKAVLIPLPERPAIMKLFLKMEEEELCLSSAL